MMYMDKVELAQARTYVAKMKVQRLRGPWQSTLRSTRSLQSASPSMPTWPQSGRAPAVLLWWMIHKECGRNRALATLWWAQPLFERGHRVSRNNAWNEFRQEVSSQGWSSDKSRAAFWNFKSSTWKKPWDRGANG